jgi:hypothetical protein
MDMGAKKTLRRDAIWRINEITFSVTYIFETRIQFKRIGVI